MADLSTDFPGIASPTPYWLDPAPPTDKGSSVFRALEAGWGATSGQGPDPVEMAPRRCQETCDTPATIPLKPYFPDNRSPARAAA